MVRLVSCLTNELDQIVSSKTVFYHGDRLNLYQKILYG